MVKVAIIDDISLVVRRGESVALIGPNGAGKSTLVKTIVGELFPEVGHVDIGNRVQVGYFSQEHEELHDSWQVVEEIMNTLTTARIRLVMCWGLSCLKGTMYLS